MRTIANERGYIETRDAVELRNNAITGPWVSRTRSPIPRSRPVYEYVIHAEHSIRNTHAAAHSLIPSRFSPCVVHAKYSHPPTNAANRFLDGLTSIRSTFHRDHSGGRVPLPRMLRPLLLLFLTWTRFGDVSLREIVYRCNIFLYFSFYPIVL